MYGTRIYSSNNLCVRASFENTVPGRGFFSSERKRLRTAFWHRVEPIFSKMNSNPTARVTNGSQGRAEILRKTKIKIKYNETHQCSFRRRVYFVFYQINIVKRLFLFGCARFPFLKNNKHTYYKFIKPLRK